MKLFVVLASLVVAISAASDQDLWVKFKNDHGKTYKSLREEKLRFSIFQEKLREIELHNQKYDKGEISYFLAINQFSDMTAEEFAEMLKGNFGTVPVFPEPTEEFINSNSSVPTAINWVQNGAVLGVKNQLRCGSCWAFSAIGAIEGQNIIHNRNRAALSEQQLVDCSTASQGCHGGLMTTSFDYIKQNGIATESAYPYIGVQGACKKVASAVKISGYVNVPKDEISLRDAVGTVGPIAVAVESELWQSYGGGIFDDPKCGSSLDHAVLAVGYGSENGKDYWLIKNSWGDWGEKGYIRLVRNKDSQCGITKLASYPLL